MAPFDDTAFVIGAGFSHQVNQAMPLVSQLTEPLSELLGRAPDRNFLRSPLPRDVESLLSVLAVDQPFLRESENLRNRALFLEIAEWLGGVVYEAQREALAQPTPAWLLALVDAWMDSRCTVVTLNYDTLVEAALMARWTGAGGAARRFDPRATYAVPVPGSLPNPPGRGSDTLSLCKLHGSLGWWYQPLAPGRPPIDVDLWFRTFKGEDFAEPTMKPWDVFRDEMLGAGQPLIVPPILTKSDHFASDLIRANWRRARDGLAAASRIVVMGYSFPTGDSSMVGLLSETAGRDKRIQVVDPCGTSVVRRIGEASGVGGLGHAFCSHDGDQPILDFVTDELG